MAAIVNFSPDKGKAPWFHLRNNFPIELFRREATLTILFKTGMMGRIGSTKLVLPKWLSYGTLSRVIRVLSLL